MKIQPMVVPVAALLLMSAATFAQTGVTPDKEDLPEPEKIYSPFVERS